MGYVCSYTALGARRSRIAPAIKTIHLKARSRQASMTIPAPSAEPEALSATQKLECMARLAGGVAHDFNNLLTVILGGCELMAIRDHREGTANQGGLVHMVKEAADRGVALTQQLLAFSRRQHLTAAAVDLNAAITAAGGSLRRLIPDDIVIEIQLDQDAGCVKSDAASLEMMLMNLAANARDAMPCGGTLTIETKRCAIAENQPGVPECVPAGSYVLCRVADTGCGMTPEVRARICEPFFTTKDTGKGAGLGLAAVYGIVKQSLGFIQVESTLGRGSAFHLYFPPAAAAAQAPASVRPARRFRDNSTVLLVEDEDAVRAIARQSLTRHHFTVLEARNGDEALRVSRRWPQPIHVMVTDVMMPQMNGRQLAEQIAPERPEMRILFMSGYIDAGVVTTKAPGPATPFLHKPFTSDGLVSKVRDLLL
jgi:two-component system cell cycle sensor histidine kinase/response regulator CckA